MDDYLRRLEGIKGVVSVFKREQEQQILRSRDQPLHVATAKPRLTTAIATQTEELLASSSTLEGHKRGNNIGGSRGDVLVHRSAVDSAVSRILNTDCVLMPVSKVVQSYQKLWPQALLVNRSKNCAEIGLIESHGSLWKLLPCGDGSAGTRVMLQTAEIGETPRYLGEELDLVELKVDAAVWNLRLCANYLTSAGVGAAATADAVAGLPQSEVPRGVIVQLEHVDITSTAAARNSSGFQGRGDVIDSVGSWDANSVADTAARGVAPRSNNRSSAATAAPAAVDPALLLVCETSMQLRNYSELAFEPQPFPRLTQQQQRSGSSSNSSGGGGLNEAAMALANDTMNTVTPEGHPVYRTYQWEVVPDSWISSELDFLDGYLQE